MYGLINFTPNIQFYANAPEDFIDFVAQHSGMVVSGADPIMQYLYAAEGAIANGYTPVYIHYDGNLTDTIFHLTMREISFQPDRTIKQIQYANELYSFRRKALNLLQNTAFIVDARTADNVIKILDEFHSNIASSSSITIVLAGEDAMFSPASYSVPNCFHTSHFNSNLKTLPQKERTILASVLLGGGEIESSLLAAGLDIGVEDTIQSMLRKRTLLRNTDNDLFVAPVMIPQIINAFEGDMEALVSSFLSRLWSAYQQKRYENDYSIRCQLAEIFSNAGHYVAPFYLNKACDLLNAIGHVQEAKELSRKYVERLDSETEPNAYELAAASARKAINALHNASQVTPDYSEIEGLLQRAIRYNAGSFKEKVELYTGVPIEYGLARAFAMSGRKLAAETLCQTLLRSAEPESLCFHFVGIAYVFVNLDDEKAAKYAQQALEGLPETSGLRNMCVLTLCSCKQQIPCSDRIKLLKDYLSGGKDSRRRPYRRAFLLTVLAEAYVEEAELSGEINAWEHALEANTEAIRLYQKWLPTPISSELYFDYKLQYMIAGKIHSDEARDIQVESTEYILRYELQRDLPSDEKVAKLIQLTETLVYLGKDYATALTSMISVLQYQIKCKASYEDIATSVDRIETLSKLVLANP